MISIDKLEILNELDVSNTELLSTYEGMFDNEMIGFFSRRMVNFSYDSPGLQKKLIVSFIELAQNVGYYSADKQNDFNGKIVGVGALLLGLRDSNVFFCIANKVLNSELNVLQRKCELINSLNREQLRELKRNNRNLIPGTNGGAHIGLIMIALITNKPLHIQYFKVDDTMSYFIIYVELSKKRAATDNE